MKYLGSFLNGQSRTWLDTALESGKSNVQELVDISSGICYQYGSYNDVIMSWRNEIPVSSFLEHADLLVSFYEKPPAALDVLLKERRHKHGLVFCPYCGKPVEPDTLDHFLPKGKWPEFSIFPDNLVPQCRDCAPIKGNFYFCNMSGSAMFLHPFYFNLLDEVYFSIRASLNHEDNQITISIKLGTRAEVDDEQKQRIRLHAKSLNIKERVVNYCHKEITAWKRRLSRTRFDFRLALEQRLSEIPESDKGSDWESALYLALIQNQEIIDYMNSLAVSERVDRVNHNEIEFDF
ncbi:HNH endonuclease [Edwardsiella tarda]|uniref:HNH endonuclease n=1 Tax=Edwardsiella tarda TaxID=636 RepID=UPI002444DC48|nr:HNH endonuclease [Edwardsiella tarda]WGE27691.1 HNH endonuclease [Edwardsiella tarda]